MEKQAVKCEFCEHDRYRNLIEFEGLKICGNCFRMFNPVIEPIYRPKRYINVHMNGKMACAPRPYGQLPGNGSY